MEKSTQRSREHRQRKRAIKKGYSVMKYHIFTPEAAVFIRRAIRQKQQFIKHLSPDSQHSVLELMGKLKVMENPPPSNEVQKAILAGLEAAISHAKGDAAGWAKHKFKISGVGLPRAF